jgi:hypothetical protein
LILDLLAFEQEKDGLAEWSDLWYTSQIFSPQVSLQMLEDLDTSSAIFCVCRLLEVGTKTRREALQR